MKKLIALLLALCMVACLFVGCAETEPEAEDTTEAPTEPADTTEAPTETEPADTTEAPTEPDVTIDNSMKVAFVTDVGNIDDHSFNQYTYEGVTTFGEKYDIETTYYKPSEDTDQAREDAINQAIADGYNTIVMAGFLFGPACAASAAQHPDVNFLALDVSAFDLGVDPIPSNVSLIVYKEEQAGYLAGYAAVKAGYTELGYCGGMAVPAVVRYGYGFVQGADAAAEELGVDVNLKYWYSGVFAPNDEIVSKMDTWYVEGTEVVFACGGAIYQSVVSAAESNEALVIGVDVDQSNISDTIITSAMKALSNSVILALTSCGTNGWAWPEAYAGTCQSLGAAEDCVGLPMETSKLGDFDQAAYDALFAAIVDGTVVIDDTSEAEVHPETAKVVVDWQ